MTSGFIAQCDLTPNPIEKAKQDRRHQGLPLIDLSSSNPLESGCLFPTRELKEAADSYWQERRFPIDPRGLLSAREAISHYYAQRTPRLTIPPEQIFITASTSESYSLLFSLLCEPGENVLSPDISYPLFEFIAGHHRIALREYSMGRGPSLIESRSLRESIDHLSRAVIIVTPHNPTGRVALKASRELNEVCLPLIVDEVFADFPYSVPQVPALGSLYPDLPVFHLNGISKMFALPDLKLGWIALNDQANERFGERLEFLNDTFLSASGLVQSMLPRIFSSFDEFIAGYRDHIHRNIRYVIDVLGQIPGIVITPPDGGSSVFVELSLPAYLEEELVISLINKGVFFHPGHFFGCFDNAHLVVSCIPEQGRLAEGLSILAEVLQDFFQFSQSEN